MAGTEGYTFSIDIPVRDEWENIDLIRTSVQNCFAAIFSDVDGCHTLSMITGELLENAMKYGRWSDKSRPRVFRLLVQGDREATRVQVENPVDPGGPEVADLQKTLAWIAEQESAEAAYRKRLLEVAAGVPGDGKLGLVRVAYEGSCELNADLTADTVTVTATLSL